MKCAACTHPFEIPAAHLEHARSISVVCSSCGSHLDVVPRKWLTFLQPLTVVREKTIKKERPRE